MIYVAAKTNGTFKSSGINFCESELNGGRRNFMRNPAMLLLVLAGRVDKTRKSLSDLVSYLLSTCLRDKNKFAALWVLDFPLLEWNEETKRFHAMHHPFTSPKKEDIHIGKRPPASESPMLTNGD